MDIDVEEQIKIRNEKSKEVKILLEQLEQLDIYIKYKQALTDEWTAKNKIDKHYKYKHFLRTKIR
jgi:hypothetical protein